MPRSSAVRRTTTATVSAPPAATAAKRIHSGRPRTGRGAAERGHHLAAAEAKDQPAQHRDRVGRQPRGYLGRGRHRPGEEIEPHGERAAGGERRGDPTRPTWSQIASSSEQPRKLPPRNNAAPPRSAQRQQDREDQCANAPSAASMPASTRAATNSNARRAGVLNTSPRSSRIMTEDFRNHVNKNSRRPVDVGHPWILLRALSAPVVTPAKAGVRLWGEQDPGAVASPVRRRCRNRIRPSPE